MCIRDRAKGKAFYHNYYADLLAEHKQFSQAAAVLETSVDFDKSPAVLRRAASYHHKNQDVEKALAVINQAVMLDDRDPTTLFHQHRLLVKLDNVAEAERVRQVLLNLDEVPQEIFEKL